MSTNSTNHVSVLDSSPILGHEDTPVPASNTSENTPLLAHEETTRTRRPPSGFTLRAVRIGLAIGALICPTTLYFGLQTGHITGYPLATALICKCWCPSLTVPENVVVVAVATTIAAMPMVTALVGIIPALIYLVEPEEGGALQLGWLQLQLWSVGICFFGTFLAMRLRGYFVVRSELQFPMAEATALVIRGCHGGAGELDLGSSERADGVDVEANSNGAEELKSSTPRLESGMKELVISGLVSMIWTLFGHFYTDVHHWPLFGRAASEEWLWNVDVSMGLIGLGIITGPAIAYHIALGAIFGWGALSWVSRARGWAPGDIGDWENGVRGWIVWPSLAALLADCFMKFLWMTGQTLRGSVQCAESGAATQRNDRAQNFLPSKMPSYIITVGLALAMIICAILVKYSIGGFMSWVQILAAVFLALPLSIVAIQAAGQTGVNPASTLGKVSQFAFAALTRRSNPLAVHINLIAGAIAESGAVQAADLMCDLKAGHKLGVSPDDLFKGQLVGAMCGAFIANAVNKLFTLFYVMTPQQGTGAKSPFEMPAAHLWIVSARLALDQGLPEKAMLVSVGTAVAFVVIAVLESGLAGMAWLPSGASFAIGMYCVPAMTTAWVVGGILRLCWGYLKGERGKSTIMLVASGLMLGEGVMQLLLMVAQVFVQALKGSR